MGSSEEVLLSMHATRIPTNHYREHIWLSAPFVVDNAVLHKLIAFVNHSKSQKGR